MQLSAAISALTRRLRHSALAALDPLQLHIYESPAHDHHQLSYSQEGEDLILARLFEHQPPGRFVDAGAMHPQRFSNTYRLYLAGWRGLNLDPTPGSMTAFQASRPRDASVEIGVSEDAQARPFFRFNEPALNTFDASLARSRDGQGGYHIVDECLARTERLDTLIDRHFAADEPIQFLNVDVEGMEVSVLRSNDWDRFRPRVVAIEEYGFLDAERAAAQPAAELLRALDYRLIAKTANTSVFVARESAVPR